MMVVIRRRWSLETEEAGSTGEENEGTMVVLAITKEVTEMVANVMKGREMVRQSPG